MVEYPSGLGDVPRTAWVLLGLVPIVILAGVWFYCTYGEAEERIVAPTILPSPVEVVKSIPDLFSKEKNLPLQIAVSLRVFIPGDLDEDGDVDQEDFGQFQACLSGAGVVAAMGCEDADFDLDGDVDVDDRLQFQECMGGANLPPGC